MDNAQHTRFVHQHLCRHSAELEQLYLLSIELQDMVLRIGQADKW